MRRRYTHAHTTYAKPRMETSSVIKRISLATSNSRVDLPRAVTPLHPSADMSRRIPPVMVAVPPPPAGPSATQSPKSTGRLSNKDTPRDHTGKRKMSSMPESSRPHDAGSPSKIMTVTASSVGTATLRLPPTDDAYSEHERQVIDEVGVLRLNPSAYADIVERYVVLSKPFISTGEMTYAEMQTHVADLQTKTEDLLKEHTELNNAKKRDVTNLQNEWALDDNDKKKGKKVAPKKAGSPDVPIDTTEQDRFDALAAIDAQYDAQLFKVAVSIQAANTALQAASSGTSVVEKCLLRLRQVKHALPALVYTRGLSLAARDTADGGKPCAEASATSQKYGFSTGPVSCCVHIDRKASPQQTVFEILLALQEATGHGLAMLLDPKMTAAGCGWRPCRKKFAATAILLSASYEEFGVIRSRAHVPLQDVKRILPLALQISSRRIIQFQSKLNIRMESPLEHPVECSNEALLILSADPGIRVCAVLSEMKDPEPASPAASTGKVLVQRCQDPSLIEVRCITPHRGQFRVTLFARGDNFSDGFMRIGAVDLNATSWSIADAVVPFATLTADFDERAATLVGPLDGTLVPEMVYGFDVVLPLSTYLNKDLERLTRSLDAADKVAASSNASAEALYAAFEEASQQLKDAQKKQADDTEAIQLEILNNQRELAKRKGRDADRGKQQIADLEEQLATLQTVVVEQSLAVQVANDKIQAHRRATRRASAQRRRYQEEQQRCSLAADRSAPLVVEVSVDERRALLPAVDASATRYRVALRTPAGGSMTLFVNGSALVTWVVALQ